MINSREFNNDLVTLIKSAPTFAKSTYAKKTSEFWKKYQSYLYEASNSGYYINKITKLEKEVLLLKTGTFHGFANGKRTTYLLSEVTKIIQNEDATFILYFKNQEPAEFDNSISWLLNYFGK